jgi:hypothetical protein
LSRQGPVAGAVLVQVWIGVVAMESEDGRMLALWDVILVALVIAMMAGVLTGGPQV